ncbi:MAG: GNAT family N-acetyltransferase [Kofleriaceae bacterium]
MRTFTADYVEQVSLDGQPIVLRLVRPDDKELLKKEFERWSPESRYARFLAPKLQLTEEELHYLCDLDQEQHFALGAISEDGETGLGIARFITLHNEPLDAVTAEAAIAVADAFHRKGLGRMLLLRLIAAARERGIERFRCEVLVENVSMQKLIETIAPDHTIATKHGVLTIDFAIDDLPEPPEVTPLDKFFRAAAENTIEWTDAVRRFWRKI